MDQLRSIVSGKKKRFTEEGFNLDLTYICPRLIAMAFPAEGKIEGMYRNPIDKVAELIFRRHEKNFVIYNLSGRQYNFAKFNGQVVSYDWEDHHSPALHILFQICEDMQQLLLKNIENVAIVHCLAGKGRTGTIISCFLLFTGLFESVEEALDYYGRKRFNPDGEGLGVNQPCQIRYINYFFRLLKGEQLYPSPKYIKEITLIGRPKFNMDGGCKPYLRIKDVLKKKELYNQKNYPNLIHKFTEDKPFTIKILNIVPLCGDFCINFYNIGMIQESKMLRISINSAFIADGETEQIFEVKEIDPSQVATDNRFPKGFQLKIDFSNACPNCTNKTTFEDKCDECSSWVASLKESWQLFQAIIQRYKVPDPLEAEIWLFKDPSKNDHQCLLAESYIKDKEKKRQTLNT